MSAVRTPRAPRARGRLATMILLSGLILSGPVVAAPEPAFAHTFLVSSTPEDNATVTELPEAFSVTMNEPLLDVSGEAAGFALEVRGADGAYYGDGCLVVDGPTLSTEPALGEPGEYTLGWQVVAADGHTVDGEIAFTWAPEEGHLVAAGSERPQACGEAAGGGSADTADEEPVAPDPAIGALEVAWVIGTVVVVAVVLFGTLLVLTRRRRP